MEKAKRYIIQDPNDGVIELIELYIQTLVKSEITRKSNKRILVDFYLHSGKKWSELTIRDCNGYLDYLERAYNHERMSEGVVKKKVKLITRFLYFLNNEKLSSFQSLEVLEQHPVVQRFTSKKKQRPSRQSKHFPMIIQEFFNYLKINDYQVVNYKRNIVLFQIFLRGEGVSISEFQKNDTQKLLFAKIKRYEEMLSVRITKEEIQKSTATLYLRTVQLFVKFLMSQNLVNHKYIISVYMRGRGSRSNEYVPKESIVELIDTIYDSSKHVLRDLAVFLIIVDTGCRPIEVSRLTLEDFDKIQRTLSFSCKKSGKRTMKVSAEVCEVIKDYIGIREQYHPKTDHLFINCSDAPITSSYINWIFYDMNVKAFGESRYPAKAFRHTYITNALQEYSFDRVSKTVGHKDWKSTYYYYNRSNQRLLANTLDKSPFKEKNGGTINDNSNQSQN